MLPRTLVAARLLGLVLMACVLLIGGANAATGDEPACTPGSGPDFSHTDVKASDLHSSSGVKCANLAGADLENFDLIQVDLEGANLEGAKLQGAQLGQATLKRADLKDADLQGAGLGQALMDGADLTGANLAGDDLVQAELRSATLDGADLSHAKLDQITASDASFVGANLSHANLTQADLRGADLDKADLSSADLTQAELGGASFQGTKGITPWSLFIAIVAGVVLVLVLAGPARKSLIRGGFKDLVLALAGALAVALGVHLFFGGLITAFVGSFGTPVKQTCSTGALCSVGVRFGIFGIWLGVFVIIGGFIVLAASKRSTSASLAS
ncbi:MAG TPA: pentapeptide repeat-containing protein [Gaiellaceae bacterium]